MARYWRFAVVTILLAVAAGCGTKAAPPDYRFEPQPRPINQDSTRSSLRHPRVVVNRVSSGTVHLLAVASDGEANHLELLTSSDGGDSFEAPVPVTATDARVSSHGENAPNLVLDNNLYAAWNEGGTIRFARSLSFGSDFEASIPVSTAPADAFNGYVTLAAAPNGDLYAVWLDARDPEVLPDTFSVYLARSTDQGATFGPNIRVANGVCPCCRPNVAFGAAGEVLVFWRKVYAGNVRDMTVAVSRDHGEHFAQSRRIAFDDWKLEGCPDSGPAVARSGNRVYVAWLTQASPDIAGVRLSWSDDSGEHWAPAVRASQDVLEANYPSLSAMDDGRVALVFQGRDPAADAGWSPTGAFLVLIGTDGGLSRPMAVPGVTQPVSRPTVCAATGERLFVAWTSAMDGRSTVFLSRARPAR